MRLPQEVDDPARLRAVADLGLVGLPYEERFDRVTRTAQRLLDVPLSFLNLVTADSLWVTSCVGFDGRQVSRDIAFCSHAIAVPDMLVVPDTTLDARFATNPLVVDAPHVRSYAGVPLRGPSGHVVGTLCVMDVRPRDWSDDDRAALLDLAAWAQDELAQGEVLARLAAAAHLQREHEQVLTFAGQGIVGVDATGTVVVANPAAEAMTGWPDGGLVGRPLHATLHDRDADGRPCTDPGCAVGPAPLAGVPVSRRRDVLWRADGSRVPVQVSSAPMVDGDVVTGAVLVVDDLTEQLAVDRMKDEFVSVVSHELRTPLTSLRGSLGLLAAGALGGLTEQGQRMADIAVSSTERLVRLVDDILDLERLVAGQVVLERRAHDVPALVRSAVDAVRGLAEDAGVEVRVTASPGEVWCDADRVVQVLVNLLGNAVKFSPRDSVVDVRAERDDAALVVEVVDRGRGIPPEQLDRVFDRFAQVDASDSRDRGGSGLGLAIARNVAEAHGGSLTARSEPGAGSTFTVVLPQRRAGTEPRAVGRRTTDGSAA